jgi:hypothetical protein
VERVESIKFLGVHITKELTGPHTLHAVVKRARQSFFSLRRLKRFSMGLQILKKLYSCTIESILTGCITAWYSKALQRIVDTAQYITGAELPAIQDLYTRRCQMKALKMLKDSSHPSHRIFSLLPHGKRYQCTKCGTHNTVNSFYPQAMRLLNKTAKQDC